MTLKGKIPTKTMLFWLFCLFCGLKRTPGGAPRIFFYLFLNISYSSSKYLLNKTSPKVFNQLIKKK